MPGVKLNFGKTGMSVSTGVPGFRKTFHSSGKMTTSVGIPGTGLSYVTTSNGKKTNQNRQYTEPKIDYSYSEVNKQEEYPEPAQLYETRPITKETPTDIHKVSDEPIDWTEILINPILPEDYDKDLWNYCYSVASKVLEGDIDTYLKVIQDLNPLDDLHEYGGGFEFDTDSPLKMEVEFNIKSDSIQIDRRSDIYQDYVCSVSIRIARDILALLPVQKVVVHTEDMGKTILSVCFDRKTMNSIKFNFIDTSDIVEKFECNMKYNSDYGFYEVDRIEK